LRIEVEVQVEVKVEIEIYIEVRNKRYYLPAGLLL